MKCEDCGSEMQWCGSMRDGRMECWACSLDSRVKIEHFDISELSKQCPATSVGIANAVPAPVGFEVVRMHKDGSYVVKCLNCRHNHRHEPGDSCVCPNCNAVYGYDQGVVGFMPLTSLQCHDLCRHKTGKSRQLELYKALAKAWGL